MAADIEVRITGLEDARAALAELPIKLRRQALRNALAAGARVVRDRARQAAPVINPADPAVVKGIRKPGTVRDAIVVRTSKQARREGLVGVFVNVRPAKGAKYKTATAKHWLLGKHKQRTLVRASQRGAQSPNDPYYWRWLEFGRKGARAFPFLKPAASALQEAFDAFKAVLLPQIQKMNQRRQGPIA